jgi:hypothetical protein
VLAIGEFRHARGGRVGRAALSNDVGVSAPKDSEPRESQGVLANLPRTRPQRSSPRRAAARRATARASAAELAPAAAKPAPAASKSRPAAGKPAAAAAKPTPAAGKPTPARSNGRPAARAQKTTRARRKPAPARAIAGSSTPREPVPRQGFECEGERASGSVQPPGGPELVASAAEIIGELAKAGLSTGERLLKDMLSRLPLS